MVREAAERLKRDAAVGAEEQERQLWKAAHAAAIEDLKASHSAELQSLTAQLGGDREAAEEAHTREQMDHPAP